MTARGDTAAAGVRQPPASHRVDAVSAAAGVGFFVLAAATGAWLSAAGQPVRAGAPPLFAQWLPHLGPGTPAALAIAGLVVWWGPGLAERLPWRRLLAAGYAAALAWTGGLAMIDGWQRGLAGRLTTEHEYLSGVGRVGDVAAMVRGFTGRILDQQPESWATHVAGHPPGALLVFVGLDRLGLSGGSWAALACVAAGASVAVTVPVTLRALAGTAVARAAVPFVVLFPGAVWVGASADGLFAGVAAAGVALLALATRRPGAAAAALAVAAGVLLGFGCFLSYGLVLMAPVAVAVLVVGRRFLPLPFALLGASAVVAAFAAAGFWWLDGYHLVVERYHQGIAAERPYAYWVWANLACLVVVAGPAAVAAVGRCLAAAVDDLRRPAASGRWGWHWLPVAAATAVLLADASGLSKAEVERIWLPFAVWLVASAAALPAGGRRGWLAVQAATALMVNHLLLTPW